MRQQITDIVNRDFPEDKRVFVTECLSSLNLSHVMAESQYNLDNTLYAILYLAKGDVNEVEELTERAKIDFRDVISWAMREKQGSG